MYLVLDPGQFEVIVTNNLFGDIITDLGGDVPGRARDGGIGQHSSRPHVDVRAGSRLGAEVRGKERREPDRRDPVGGADARNARARQTKQRPIEAAVLHAVPENQVTQDSVARSGRGKREISSPGQIR